MLPAARAASSAVVHGGTGFPTGFTARHTTGQFGRNSSGSLAMLAAMRLASSRVRRCAAERRPGSSFEIDVGAQKRRGFRKTRVESSRAVDVAFGGRP